jgi:predicted ABC-type sugar transport system permease subunit
VLERSRWGYEIRLIGDNPHAARYAGINIARNIILVMMFSGALAGLAGMSEIRRRPSSARAHLAGLRLHRHHRGLAGQAESFRRRVGLDPVWRVDRGRA